MASKEVVYQREFCFTTIREYFRTISGEEREGYNLLRDVGTQAQSPTSSLTQGVRRDSDYSSDSEPPVEKDDEEEPHWGALGLDRFKGCAGSYVDLYCLQLHLLAEWDYWTSVSSTVVSGTPPEAEHCICNNCSPNCVFYHAELAEICHDQSLC